MTYIHWAFWNIYYTVARRPGTALGIVAMREKTRSPWWKFKPIVQHHEISREWRVWFSEDRCTVETRLLPAKVYVSEATGEIVGLSICDEVLQPTVSKAA